MGQPEPLWAKSFKIDPNRTKSLSLFWGNMNHFGPKRPKQSKSGWNLFLWQEQHESLWIKRVLSKTVHIVAIHSFGIPFIIKVPNQEKKNDKRKKWKKNYDLSIMHLGYLDKFKQEKSPSKKRETWKFLKKKNLKWLTHFPQGIAL